MKFRIIALTLGCLVSLAAQETPTDAAEPWPHYARVTGTQVRVRAGAGDFHAELLRLDRPAAVRAISKEGDWVQVEVPGGLVGFAALGRTNRRYLEEVKPGEGLVLVNDLQIRGTPNTDFPPLGELNAGDRVVVLDIREKFARIIAPSATRGWIHNAYVKRDPAQDAAKADFDALVRTRREAILKSGANSRMLLEREAKTNAINAQADAAFSRYETELAKDPEKRDIATVRKDLMAVRDGTEAGDPLHDAAVTRLKMLDEWTSLRDELAAARASLEAAKREAVAAESRHAGDLEKIRKDVEEKVAKGEAAKKEKPSPYVASGWLRRTFPVSGVVEPGSPYALFQGNRRQYILESSRYELSEFKGKLVGILAAEGPFERTGLPHRVLRITKMEILAEKK